MDVDRGPSTARSGAGRSHRPGACRPVRCCRPDRSVAVAPPDLMPRKQSAGLLLFRRRAGALEVLLVHPGGPFWARKDDGAWSVPKGEIDQHEDALAAARREVEEETGARPSGPFIALTPLHQSGGKIVHVWPWRASSIHPHFEATCSRWNGHRSPDRAGPSRKWIEPSGSTSQRHPERSSRPRRRSWSTSSNS